MLFCLSSYFSCVYSSLTTWVLECSIDIIFLLKSLTAVISWITNLPSPPTLCSIHFFPFKWPTLPAITVSPIFFPLLLPSSLWQLHNTSRKIYDWILFQSCSYCFPRLPPSSWCSPHTTSNHFHFFSISMCLSFLLSIQPPLKTCSARSSLITNKENPFGAAVRCFCDPLWTILSGNGPHLAPPLPLGFPLSLIISLYFLFSLYYLFPQLFSLHVCVYTHQVMAQYYQTEMKCITILRGNMENISKKNPFLSPQFTLIFGSPTATQNHFNKRDLAKVTANSHYVKMQSYKHDVQKSTTVI